MGLKRNDATPTFFHARLSGHRCLSAPSRTWFARCSPLHGNLYCVVPWAISRSMPLFPYYPLNMSLTQLCTWIQRNNISIRLLPAYLAKHFCSLLLEAVELCFFRADSEELIRQLPIEKEISVHSGSQQFKRESYLDNFTFFTHMWNWDWSESGWFCIGTLQNWIFRLQHLLQMVSVLELRLGIVPSTLSHSHATPSAVLTLPWLVRNVLNKYTVR